MSAQRPALLEIRELRVQIDDEAGTLELLHGLSFRIETGRTLAIVGESGSGKSVTARAIMGLLDAPARVSGGTIRFEGRDLLQLPRRECQRIRGDRIAMIFQDPISALNPTMRVGDQIAETLVAHRGMSWREARKRAVELLDRTRIAEAAMRVRQYPFEFSGGMLQRVMIATAIACGPALLIADEPTTALDVTVQEQILELVSELQRDDAMSLLLITHDLGVVAHMADDVAVMYAGRIVESGPVESVFDRPAHPYTIGLRNARPGLDEGRTTGLVAIPGSPPSPRALPQGCAFAPRCSHAMRVCAQHQPPAFEFEAARLAHCWLNHPIAPSSVHSPPQPPASDVS